jgi:2'-5' RNA ligase
VHANWFLALKVPADDWFAERVPAPPAGLRRFAPQDLHLTLAFLGACGEARARRAWELAGAWGLGPTQVRLGPVAPMGGPRRYSALSILLEGGRELIEAEVGRCRGSWLLAAGARPNPRPPRAHVTIARPLRRASVAQRAAGLEWAAGLQLSGISLVLAELALYTWAEDRTERLFRQVERRLLVGPD